MRWGKTTEVIHMPKRVKRDWKTYNDQLVKRGEVKRGEKDGSISQIAGVKQISHLFSVTNHF
jgi:hypothetical protein